MRYTYLLGMLVRETVARIASRHIEMQDPRSTQITSHHTTYYKALDTAMIT
jgi:hypothetical protein